MVPIVVYINQKWCQKWYISTKISISRILKNFGGKVSRGVDEILNWATFLVLWKGHKNQQTGIFSCWIEYLLTPHWTRTGVNWICQECHQSQSSASSYDIFEPPRHHAVWAGWSGPVILRHPPLELNCFSGLILAASSCSSLAVTLCSSLWDCRRTALTTAVDAQVGLPANCSSTAPTFFTTSCLCYSAIPVWQSGVT